jgi:hypothetical protein
MWLDEAEADALEIASAVVVVLLIYGIFFMLFAVVPHL